MSDNIEPYRTLELDIESSEFLLRHLVNLLRHKVKTNISVQNFYVLHIDHFDVCTQAERDRIRVIQDIAANLYYGNNQSGLRLDQETLGQP